MPLVTIIIPVYNTEKYLKQCLNSVVNQTYKNIEIMIIDDASTDLSKNIIASYEKTYKNIKGIYFHEHFGISIARNIGIDLAQGDYIFFLDSDDYLKSTAIETLVNLANYYSVPLVKGKFKKVYNFQKNTLKNEKSTMHYKNIEEEKDFIKKQAGYVWNHLYSHDLIDTIRFPSGLYYEDIAFAFPILTKAKNCVVTNETLYFYRRHLNSTTLKNMLSSNEHILDVYYSLLAIKENCLNLGTYETYQEQIDEILKFISIYPIYTANTWISMPKEEKRKLIQLLYQYASYTYGYESILEIPLVKEKCQNNAIYQMRVKQTAKSLTNQINEIQGNELSLALELIRNNQ